MRAHEFPIQCLYNPCPVILTDTKVGRYTGILSYSRYLVDTCMAVLVLTPYRYTVIGRTLHVRYTGIPWLSLVIFLFEEQEKFTNEKQTQCMRARNRLNSLITLTF